MKDKQKNSSYFEDVDNFINNQINISDVIIVAGSIFMLYSINKALKSDKNIFLKFLEETRKDKKCMD